MEHSKYKHLDEQIKDGKSHVHGHPVWFDTTVNRWRYKDNNERVDTNIRRECKRCGVKQKDTLGVENDQCIGTLPGVDNACCGHGVRSQSYIRFTNGVVVTGFIVAERMELAVNCHTCGRRDVFGQCSLDEVIFDECEGNFKHWQPATKGSK